MPKAWSGGHTFAWWCKGHKVMGIKQARCTSMPYVSDTAPLEHGRTPMEHVQHTREDETHLQTLSTIRFSAPMGASQSPTHGIL